MISYKELGLVNTREMFKRAVAGGYAIPAFNFNTMEQMQAIVMAAVETKSPVIMQVSKGARNYANGTILRNLAKGAVEYAKELGCEHPEIVLHLDHGDSFELCKDCIDNGFSSVMIDGSSLPYEENVALAKKVVDYAHQFDVTVEAELGVLAGVEDEVQSAESHYTCHHHWHSTSSLRLRRSSLASQSCSTVLLLFQWKRLRLSTSTAVSSKPPSVFQRSSSARLPSLLSARSTSTLTLVSLSSVFEASS